MKQPLLLIIVWFIVLLATMAEWIFKGFSIKYLLLFFITSAVVGISLYFEKKRGR